MSLDGLDLVRASLGVLKEAHEQGWLGDLRNRFRRKQRVLVLGTVGVGKTNFLVSLRKALPEAIGLLERTQFARKHRLALDRELFEFVDTPGQIGHQARRLAAIRDAMKGNVSGVINVVAYGYHEYPTEPTEPPLDERGRIREPFLERHRQIEVEALDEWKLLLGDPGAAGWMVTVANKADLWWDRKEAVLRTTSAAPTSRPLTTCAR
jgi:energy-coupling factor transporter ATP-binding protein EcfA2